jgi:cyclohexanecarboxylate-CoA ligase
MTSTRSAGGPGNTAFAPDAWWNDQTLRDWIERAAAETPLRTAVVGLESALTYGELHARARIFAARLRDLGLGRGDVIAAQLPNSVEFVVTYLACSQIGAILQTVHMPYRGAEIEPLLRYSGAKAFVCVTATKDFRPAELALSLRARNPKLRHIVAVGDHAPDGALAFPDRSADCQAAFERSNAADTFLLLFTSGTVAAPKGVPVAYRTLLANARLSAPELAIDGTARLLSAAPFTHLYGLFSINLALATGATTALLPQFTPAGFAAALDQLRPTGTFVGPAHLAACRNAGLLTPERLSSLRFVLISGSVCAPELARFVQDLMPDGKVLQLWGMSELQAGSFTRPGDSLSVRTTTVGRASPGTELRVTEGDQLLGPGLEGELQVRGCSVFDGYLGNDCVTADAFTADGWFRTGDLARIDPNGNVQLTGRLKELINRGGIKFNPVDVEIIIDQHPSVAQCALVPMPDPILGERACCFAVLRQGTRLSLEDLCTWLAQHAITKIKWPERLEFIDEMPMTPTRKVRKSELVARLSLTSR